MLLLSGQSWGCLWLCFLGGVFSAGGGAGLTDWVCGFVMQWFFADSRSGISASVTLIAMACPWISYLGFCFCCLLPVAAHIFHSCVLLLSWHYTFVWPFWPLQVALDIGVGCPGNVSVL
jgi:hypothetical protein